MSSDWHIVEVEQACELIVDCVNKTAPVVSEKTPYRMIRTTNIRNGRVNLDGCRYVDEPTFEKWTRRAKLQFGDVVLTREAPIGEVGFVTEPENIFLGQRVMQYRANPNILAPRFLLYAFLSPSLQHQFGTHEGTGSVVSHIRVGDCFKFKIPLPSLSVQTNIAEMLGALDDRITLLRETNTTLEAIAQTLFKSWFVDFDPVHAKQQGREPEGMDSDTAALFPDSFEESELGLVPRGWRIGIVEDLCDVIISGGTPSRSKKQFWEGGSIPWFKTGDFCDGFLLWSSERITDEALKGSAAKLLPENSVLMAIYAAPTVGRLGILTESATFNQACTGMVAKAEIGPWFLYWTLYFGRKWFNSRANGAAQQNISKAIVASYGTIVPPKQVLLAFNEVVRPLHSKIRACSEQAQILANLRDTLLPRLISGQLRLPDTEADINEVLALGRVSPQGVTRQTEANLSEVLDTDA